MWKELNPEYLRDRWLDRVTSSYLGPLSEVLRAVAWFSLVTPVVEVAWIQSAGGKRLPVLHGAVVVLVLTGSFAELVGRFMAVGVEDATRNIIANFQLDDWETAQNGDADGMGWRVLDLGHMVMVRGLLQWIDAFEWLCLFGLLSLLFFSVSSEQRTFSTRWATLGLCVAVLSVADLAANVARLDSWVLASEVALALTAMNTLVLLPIWLVWLAATLPDVRDDAPDLFEREGEAPPEKTERAALNPRFPIPETPPGTLGRDDDDYNDQEEKREETTQGAGVDRQVEAYASKLQALATDAEIL